MAQTQSPVSIALLVSGVSCRIPAAWAVCLGKVGERGRGGGEGLHKSALGPCYSKCGPQSSSIT